VFEVNPVLKSGFGRIDIVDAGPAAIGFYGGNKFPYFVLIYSWFEKVGNDALFD
jgi:hypothetical protein